MSRTLQALYGCSTRTSTAPIWRLGLKVRRGINDFIFHPDGAAVISQFLMAPTAPVLRLKRCPPFASSSKILELSVDLSI